MRILIRPSYIHIFLEEVFFRKFHHHPPRRSDDLPCQEDVLQTEGLDLLPVFRFHSAIHLNSKNKLDELASEYQRIVQTYVDWMISHEIRQLDKYEYAINSNSSWMSAAYAITQCNRLIPASSARSVDLPFR